MKQGITPQYWKQENNGRYFTKETQIFSPLPILTDTLLAHPKARNDGQLAFPAIHFIEGISREVGQEVMQSFSLPYPSNPEAHIVKIAQDGIFCLCLIPTRLILWGNFNYSNVAGWLLALWLGLRRTRLFRAWPQGLFTIS